MRFALGLLFVPLALGHPSAADGAVNVEARANSKVNQYRSVDDWYVQNQAGALCHFASQTNSREQPER